jgi:hypothetical protein
MTLVGEKLFTDIIKLKISTDHSGYEGQQSSFLFAGWTTDIIADILEHTMETRSKSLGVLMSLELLYQQLQVTGDRNSSQINYAVFILDFCLLQQNLLLSKNTD